MGAGSPYVRISTTLALISIASVSEIASLVPKKPEALEIQHFFPYLSYCLYCLAANDGQPFVQELGLHPRNRWHHLHSQVFLSRLLGAEQDD